MAYSLNPNDHMLTIRGRQVVNGEEDGETVYTQCRYKRGGARRCLSAYDSVEEGPTRACPSPTRNLLRIEGSDRRDPAPQRRGQRHPADPAERAAAQLLLCDAVRVVYAGHLHGGN